MAEYVVTVDVAKKQDYSAIMVTRIQTETEAVQGKMEISRVFYDIVWIDQFNQMSYSDLVDRIMRVVTYKDLVYSHDLVVDATGVGEAVVDQLRQAGANPIPLVFTAGERATASYFQAGALFFERGQTLQPLKTLREIRVPKKDLVTAGSVLMEQGRVRVAPGLKFADTFRKELIAFAGKVNEKTRKVRFEAQSEFDHDDLVVCYLMMAWWVQQAKRQDTKVLVEKTTDWEPADFY